MCVALPGIVTEIGDGVATVDFNGNQVKALTGITEVQCNDYVLVHAGCIIQVMSEKEAIDLIQLMHEVNEDIEDEYELDQ